MNKISFRWHMISFLVFIVFLTGIFLFFNVGEIIFIDREHKELTRNAIEREAHYFVNIERLKRGIPALEWDEDLSRIARIHSMDMMKNNFYGHEDMDGSLHFQRYKKYGYDCDRNHKEFPGSENIYMGYDSEKSFKIDSLNVYYTSTEIAKNAVGKWLGSEGHKFNMLSKKWKFGGIGIAYGMEHNDLYFNNQPIYNNAEKKMTNWASPHNIFITQNFC
jgi:uncharacterized protein YkwD